MKTNKIYQGDALEVLKKFPDNSIHMSVTSPPYWGLRDYGEEGQLGLEETPKEYVNKLANIFDEVKRILREDGTLWLNLGDTYNNTPCGGMGKQRNVGNLHESNFNAANQRDMIQDGVLKQKDLVGIPWRVAFELQRRGWYLRSDIIWHKRNPIPSPVKDRPTSSHEYIFLLSKSKQYYYDYEAVKEKASTNENRPAGVVRHREYKYDSKLNKVRNRDTSGEPKKRKRSTSDYRNKRDVWTVNTKPFPKAHFAVYNRKLIRPCIKAGCPEKVCSKCNTPYERKTKTIKNKDRSQEGRTKSTKEQRMGKNPPPEKGWEAVTIDEGLHSNCDCKADTKGGIVLDPFMGAGTTALEALGQNKDFVGIDIGKKFIDMSYQRLVEHGYYEYNQYLPENKKSKEKGLF